MTTWNALLDRRKWDYWFDLIRRYNATYPLGAVQPIEVLEAYKKAKIRLWSWDFSRYIKSGGKVQQFHYRMLDAINNAPGFPFSNAAPDFNDKEVMRKSFKF